MIFYPYFYQVTNKLCHEMSGKVTNKNILSESDLLDTWEKCTVPS